MRRRLPDFKVSVIQLHPWLKTEDLGTKGAVSLPLGSVGACVSVEAGRDGGGAGSGETLGQRPGGGGGNIVRSTDGNGQVRPREPRCQAKP